MKVTTLVLLVTLAACGGGEPPAAADESAATPFDGLHDSIDKAEDVERQLMEQKQRMDDALEAADGNVDEPLR